MRADVLALTAGSLAALTNRGLVKRATREVEAAPPGVAEDADGTLRGSFADGAAPALPTGGLERATCTCGAAGVCRHVLGLILAYQAAGGSGEKPAGGDAPAGGTGEAAAGAVGWSPGAFTDERVAERIGARMMAAARRARRAGYHARVIRPSAADPVARVDLGSATVRFLVPHDLGFVHTDAVAGMRDDVIALAVWAFREADRQAPGQADVRVDVGEPATERGEGPGLAAGLATEVLLGGAVQLGAGIVGGIADVTRRLERDGLRWPLLAVGELAEQLEAYRDRGSGYSPERLAELVGELHARARAARGLGGGARARVLGTGEAAETALRRVRLDGLGCRVVAAGSAATGDERRVVEVYLAHADTGTVLVLRRVWDGDEPGARLGRRRLAGSSVGALAAGTLVTESAVRSAGRAVRLTTSRVAKATVTASRGAWDRLPATLLVRDLAALAGELDRLPPRVVRPRIEAELVRVLEVAQVHAVAYAPGAQRLRAGLADRHGNRAVLTATHTAAAPGRLDAVAEALAAGPSFVSGVVRKTSGGIEIDPLAIVAGATVVVPDLGEAGAGELARPDGVGKEPLAEALDHAIATLAEMPHRGLRHLPPGFGDRLRKAGDGLHRVGLHRAAAALETLRDALGPDPGEAVVRAWVDAHLRLTVTAELR
ncbi:SWIM zinc finger family protein [Dactylosporangium sp. CA-139114]|uniref:SWIM zinc finger family protein n=1 Tax=Dactylosporangium sp. CA-139114 TaxID=3239931 RepID=UPI003D96CA6B